ncbi:helix-turn-helix domain-containing protein [Phascolarctobacterium sp.]|uniref:helix-turn-helix domain-containing protein n=1 Tax=Phascolarctobacterium sp. TaxID=2049039 RepID=UPI003864FCBA
MIYKLKEIRQKQGLTQLELANKANIARATIIKIENGDEVEVKVSTLQALAEALGCSVADFLCA